MRAYLDWLFFIVMHFTLRYYISIFLEIWKCFMLAEKAVMALSALAQETRLAIFRLLVQSANAVTAGEVADRLVIAPSTLSFHLKTLQQAGLISVRQDGRCMYYSPNRALFGNLLDYLTENCCAGAGCPITEKEESVCQH